MTELWAVVLTRNNLALTQKAIASLEAQQWLRVPLRILVVDNESSDNTLAWLATQPQLFRISNAPANSVAGAWNQALRWIFYGRGGETALVINNDAVLRPDAYYWLLQDGGGFVTCVGSDDPSKIQSLAPPDPAKKRPHPDYSCFMIRRWVFEKVGPFNEDFKGAYCEDSDHHLRMHRAGIGAEALELPFLHVGGGAATVKSAASRERKRIQLQADRNRELFKRLYGFAVGSPEYYAAFGHGSPQ